LRDKKRFETDLFLSQSVSFKQYHRHIHAFSFKTVQKQKPPMFI